MSPNHMKNMSQSDSSVESAVSSPTRRCRSLSMASQSSSERATPKTRQAGSSSSNHMKCQRKSSSLPVETVEYLKAWMMSPEHIAHPYPTDQEKAQIMADTGIELKQLTNWFVNNRKRYWKPRVEARLQQQAHVAVAVAAAVASAAPMTTATTDATPTMNMATNDFQGPASYMSPPSAISFMTLDNMAPLPTPASASIAPKPVVSLTSSPVDQDDTRKSENTMVVTAENLAAYLPVTPISPHTVSELSSSASDVGSVDSSSLMEHEEAFHNTKHEQHQLVSESSSDDMESTHRTTTPTTTTLIETVDVHILRPPTGRKEPTIEDVTILPHVPMTRILRTFPSCALTYHQSSDRANRKKMQSRRDAEIVRIKKHYLRCYLAERDLAVEAFLGKRASLVVDSDDEAEETPRLKYRRVAADPDDYWRQVCQTAVHPHDEALPSLEEAAHMFGYTATASS